MLGEPGCTHGRRIIQKLFLLKIFRVQHALMLQLLRFLVIDLGKHAVAEVVLNLPLMVVGSPPFPSMHLVRYTESPPPGARTVVLDATVR